MSDPYIKHESIQYEQVKQAWFELHTHDFYEILYFVSGEAKYYIEGNIYSLSPGDIFLMKKGEAHNLLVTKSTPYDRVVINFNESALLSSYSKKILEFINNKPLGKNNRYPNRIFKENNWFNYIDKLIKSKDIIQKRLYLTVLLNELSLNSGYIQNDEVIEDTVHNIVAYINRHLKDDLTLDFLCNKFQISQTHLNRKFKTIVGTTVKQYILNKRIVMANGLIKSGAAPTSIYLDCGFKDYSTFFRAYINVYNTSPNSHKEISRHS